ncbi:MAG: nuclear transport factor 2 family protein [Dehalococcoidia bacterium]
MTLPTDDIVAIQQLVARYNHAIDGGDAEGWANCFTAEASFQISGREPTVGREALAEIVRRRADGSRHVTTNMLIEGDGGTATMRAYLTVLRERAVSVTGSYTDRLVKVDGRWLFEQRLFTADE